ncbi:MAG: hypothetical protein QOH41_3948 [Blastocatellia bacterium]|jgi:hypothetical protein|nr:hypothetical protein [Blastocatellia bacterium]
MPAKKISKKKTAKKSVKKAGGPIPPINVACLDNCYRGYMICLKKGDDPETCLKRYIRCIRLCFGQK